MHDACVHATYACARQRVTAAAAAAAELTPAVRSMLRALLCRRAKGGQRDGVAPGSHATQPPALGEGKQGLQRTTLSLALQD